MPNVTNISVNAASTRTLPVTIKVCVVIPFFCIFLCCVVVMLYIFASHRQFLDCSRYILFVSMLISDTLQIICSVLLFFLAMGQIKFALGFCFPLLFLSNAAFWHTPLILATMSLERYVAIMYPLQTPTVWSPNRIWIIVVSLWLLSCTIPLIEVTIGQHYPLHLFSISVYCQNVYVNSSPAQKLFRTVVNVVCFAVVSIIILFTYVRILLETRGIRQDKTSVNKATHTVLLHGFQLLLCMLALTMPITETLIVLRADWPPEDIAFFNYFCFILIPCFLSPLIYGFRDQSLRRNIGKSLFCCSNKVKSSDRGRL